jgi:Na+/phosphate symporter
MIALLFRLALAAVVVEQEPPVRALGTAWALFRDHWLILLEVVVMIMIGTSLAAVVALSAAAVGIVLLFGPLVLLSFVGGAPVVLSIVLGLAALLFLLSLFAVGAVLATFQQAVWVLLFVRLKESPPLSKLFRFFAAHSRIFGRNV